VPRRGRCVAAHKGCDVVVKRALVHHDSPWNIFKMRSPNSRSASNDCVLSHSRTVLPPCAERLAALGFQEPVPKVVARPPPTGEQFAQHARYLPPRDGQRTRERAWWGWSLAGGGRRGREGQGVGRGGGRPVLPPLPPSRAGGRAGRRWRAGKA
jgi:hypothetical protein